MPRSCSSGSSSVVGRALIDVARAMLGAAVEQHPLGDRRLAGIDVGDDADVADFFELRAMAMRVKRDQESIVVAARRIDRA